MRNMPRTMVALALAGVAALAVSVAPAGAQPNELPDRISVYNFNINRMDREWEDWVAWIKENGKPVPDLILLQDMDTKAERLEFQAYLSDPDTGFGGTWLGRQGASGANGWHTAVVWRGERFDVLQKRGWWGFGDPDNSDDVGRCVDDTPDGGSGERENGSPAVQVRLFDKTAGRNVSAVSFKTSGKLTPTTCAWSNMRKVNFKLQQPDWTGDIMVMGTDANSSDRTSAGAWRCWYRGSNKSITHADGTPKRGCDDQLNQNFFDPIFEKCEADDRAVKTCLDEDHVTRNGLRIDFVFAKVPSDTPVGFSLDETETLPWRGPNEDTSMSDHKGLRTMIFY